MPASTTAATTHVLSLLTVNAPALWEPAYADMADGEIVFDSSTSYSQDEKKSHHRVVVEQTTTTTVTPTNEAIQNPLVPPSAMRRRSTHSSTSRNRIRNNQEQRHAFTQNTNTKKINKRLRFSEQDDIIHHVESSFHDDDETTEASHRRHRMLVLLLQPQHKTFEFIPVEYDNNNDSSILTVAMLLSKLPQWATDPHMRDACTHVIGLCSGGPLSDDDVQFWPPTASLGTSMSTTTNPDVWVAVLRGYTAHEMWALAQPLLGHKQGRKLLRAVKRKFQSPHRLEASSPVAAAVGEEDNSLDNKNNKNKNTDGPHEHVITTNTKRMAPPQSEIHTVPHRTKSDNNNNNNNNNNTGISHTSSSSPPPSFHHTKRDRSSSVTITHQRAKNRLLSSVVGWRHRLRQPQPQSQQSAPESGTHKRKKNNFCHMLQHANDSPNDAAAQECVDSVNERNVKQEAYEEDETKIINVPTLLATTTPRRPRLPIPSKWKNVLRLGKRRHHSTPPTTTLQATPLSVEEQEDEESSSPPRVPTSPLPRPRRLFCVSSTNDENDAVVVNTKQEDPVPQSDASRTPPIQGITKGTHPSAPESLDNTPIHQEPTKGSLKEDRTIQKQQRMREFLSQGSRDSQESLRRWIGSAKHTLLPTRRRRQRSKLATTTATALPLSSPSQDSAQTSIMDHTTTTCSLTNQDYYDDDDVPWEIVRLAI